MNKDKLHAKSSIEVGKLWDENADLWINLTAKGHDLYRDHIGTPGFFSILPAIDGLRGLDIGCGDGHHTRLLAERGAKMIGMDLSPKFIQYAKNHENTTQLGIEYLLGNVLELPYPNNSFDFVTSFFSLIDIPEYEIAIAEAYRTIKKEGFFQFLIPHPCTWTPDFEWIFDESGNKKGAICSDYFTSDNGKVMEWLFESVDPNSISGGQKFKSPQFRRTLTKWINSLVNTGFVIEEIFEPKADEKLIEQHSILRGASLLPIFLIVRCRK